jgi:AcrR family transcriptional regulator
LSSDGERSALGLRERKKAKTRAAVQRHALRLFREQGYEATTVSQIAEAAEISPSTFFRYFPTKEDVVLYDDLDPLFIAAYEAQPAELSPIQALRGALRVVLNRLPAQDVAEQLERAQLIVAVPELRMRMLDQFVDIIDLVAELFAKRMGRRADESEVRTAAGAVTGALLVAMFDAIKEPTPNFLELMDVSLAYLEAGMPL